MKLCGWVEHIFSDDDGSDRQTFDVFCELSNECVDIHTRIDECENRRSASIYDKFRLLMWKNFLLQNRHKLQTIVQIVIPLLFTGILLFIRYLLKPETNAQITTFTPFSISKTGQLHPNNDNHQIKMSLVYLPKNDIFGNLLEKVRKNLGLVEVYGVNTTKKLEEDMKNPMNFAGILFDHPANITELPCKLIYALRFPSELRMINQTDKSKEMHFHWQTNLKYPLLSGGGPRAKNENTGAAPNYFREGFLTIQHVIAGNFAILLNKEKKHHLKQFDKYRSQYYPNISGLLDKIYMQRFPYPSYLDDILLSGLKKSIGLFIMLSFVYPIISTVRFIAVEKEKQLKEIMKIMGMPVWLHWTCWFIRTMIFTLISNSFIVAMFKIPMHDPSIAIFTYSNYFAVWIFLFVYSITMTTYCFLLSVLFTKANTAAALSGLIWFISYMPFVFLTVNNLKMPKWLEWLASASPNVAMSYGCKTILDLERNGQGLQWTNFWNNQSIENNFTVGTIAWIMLVTSFIFLVVALYVEKLFPGEHSVPEKWNFIFRSDFWLGDDGYTKKDTSYIHLTKNDNFEAEPTDGKIGVKVQNLRKIFDNGKVACKGVTFNMFCDEITVLLGHNGAGKSTTIKMLTGMIPPTSGTAIINGYDIRTDLRRARESIGICPQHDILFDELTVREHIEFYSRLKGLKKQDVQHEVRKYVKILNLESKIDTPSKALSGGMQRKLSFIVALCGDSKIVLCDEPSSGVDASARRELWDLLQREKHGRTIILTTHFMDEADVLGDRIAIMADGEVMCYGTPFFLKKRFGSGYRLICVKKLNCNSSDVTAVLRQFISDIELLNETVEELSYALPYKYSSIFAKMFEQLENDQEKLKIEHFNVSSTELEEVFLKMGSDHNKSHDKVNYNVGENEVTFNMEASKKVLVDGFRLRMNHWWAMMKKRYYCFTNNWFMFLVQIIVLIFFTVISVTFVRISKEFNDLPSIDLALSDYKDTTTTIIQTPQSQKNVLINRIFTEYRNKFKNNSGKDELDESNEDIQKHFLRFKDEIRIRSNTRYLVGLSTTVDYKLIAWFNNQLFHTAPLSLNLLHNAVLKTINESYSIQVSNWPIPYRAKSKALLTANGNDMGTQLAQYISFAMAFIAAMHIMIHIRERTSKAKLLQFISGVDASTFWVISFLFDFLTYSLASLAFCMTVYAFQENYWSSIQDLLPLIPVLTLFGLSSLAITYVASFLFSTASYGFVSLAITFVFTGTSFFKLITILLFPNFHQQEMADRLKWIFLPFPHFALGYSLFNMHQFRINQEVCRLKCGQLQGLTMHEHECDSSLSNYCDINIYDWKEPGIGRSLTYMAIVAIVFFLILWIVEYRIISKIIRCCRRSSQLSPTCPIVTNTIDVDVITEKLKVNAMTTDDIQNNNLVVRNLTKFYGNFLAVKEICIAVRMAECFGLLGVNGAGKTTTFKMITGDTPISSGDIFVNGLNLKNQLAEVHKIIGYCPQFDALLDNLTGKQTMEIFGLLRGYRLKDITAMSARLANNLNFTKYIDKQIKSYSGGNKRKLSTAIALMGNPAVVYLDEPSSGMDPAAKRNMWNVVLQARNSGTSIVLTSHSMEECEALCTRLAIMVNGEFKCLGSVQHLKNQFSKEFLLSVKMRLKCRQTSTEPNSNKIQSRINNFICRSFPGSYLKEKYQGLLTYSIPQTNEMTWSSMFDHMENVKGMLAIEDYSISQTSLEQVFLSFTKPYDHQ